MNFSDHVDRWKHCTLCPLHKVRRQVVLARGKLPADVLMVGEAPGLSEDVLGAPFTGPAGQLLDRIITATELENYRIAFTNLVGCIPMTIPPTVVNVKRTKCDVLIDRTTKWGNPFVIGRDGDRTEVIEKFDEWFPQQPDLLNALRELEGKTIGCHCHPLPCHGDTLVRYFRKLVKGKTEEPDKVSIEACQDRLLEMIEIADPRHIVAVGLLSEKWLPKLFDLTIPVTSVPHPAAILRAEEPHRSMLARQCQVALEDVAESLSQE